MTLWQRSSASVGTRRGVVAAFAVCVAASATPGFAAVNAYLTLSGITGPSTSLPGAIDILSFSVGASSPDPGKLTKAACSNLSLMKVLDNTSPLLVQAVLLGKSFASATLIYQKPFNEKQQTYFSITLPNAVLTSVQESGSNENPSESLSLMASTMTLSYWPQNADGSVGDPVVTSVTCSK